MGIVLTEIAKIPVVPAKYRHQSGVVKLVKYLVAEGTSVEPGTPLALLENWWARFELVCEVKAIAAKNLLDGVPGITLSEDSPVTFLLIDPGDFTKGATLCAIRHIEDIRARPSSQHIPPNKSLGRTRDE
jgi:hypothetical protein